MVLPEVRRDFRGLGLRIIGRFVFGGTTRENEEVLSDASDAVTEFASSATSISSLVAARSLVPRISNGMPVRISIVLPIRNCEAEIAARIDALVASLPRLVDSFVEISPSEIIIVDDGSRDGSAEICQQLADQSDVIRFLRHDRPRGLEAAGQTGLERASGDVVLIQERDAQVNFADVIHLLRLCEDTSIVAARAESVQEPVTASLVRRVRLWGIAYDKQLGSAKETTPSCGLQMVRRSNLQRLSGPDGKRYRLEGRSHRVTSLQREHAAGTPRSVTPAK